MAHSYSQRRHTFTCLQCGATFAPDIWLIIDTAERPDLLARVMDGSIYTVVCPNGHADEADRPLLLYRPAQDPLLIFCPAQMLTAERNQKNADELVRILRKSLPGDQKSGGILGRLRGFLTLGDFPADARIVHIKRAMLPALLSGDADALPRELLDETIPPAYYEVVVALFADGVDINEQEEIDRALAARPELKAKFDAAMAAWAGDEEARVASPTATELTPLMRALQQLLASTDWGESYRLLTAHPELLGDEADGLLAALLDQAKAAGNKNTVQALGELRALLRRSREIGAAAAFAEMLGTTPEQFEAAALDGDGLEIPPEFDTDVARAGAAERRYQATGDRAALQEAAATWQRILGSPTFPAAPERFQLAALNLAGRVFFSSYFEAGQLSDLDQALALWQDVVARAPADSPDRAMFLANLGSGLRDRYVRTGQAVDLDAAIAATEDALTRIPADAPDRGRYLTNLGLGLRDRYVRTGRPADLDAAIAAFEEAVVRTPTHSPDRARLLTHLGTGLRDRYARTGRPADLDAAIAATEDALTRTPAHSPDRAMFLTNLGIGLSDRYERTGRPTDLDAAIAAYQDAVARTSADSPDRASRLNNLGAGLRNRYARAGQAADLDAAIAALEDAVARSPAGSPDRAMHLNNLGIGLHNRYARTGQAADLDAAIAAFEDAAARSPAGSPDRAMPLNNLGGVLRAHYERTGRAEDLDAAIAAYEDAVATLDRALLDSPVDFMLGQQSRWSDLYARLATAYLDGGQPGAALAVAEGSKSRLLANLMGRGDLPAPAVIPAELAARERALAERLNRLDVVALSGSGLSTPGAGGDEATGRGAIADRAAVVAELRAVWSDIETHGLEASDYVALRRGDRPTAGGLAKLSASLPPHVALLSLLVTGEPGDAPAGETRERRRVLLFLLRGEATEPVVVEVVEDWDTLRYDYMVNYVEEVLDRATLLRLGRHLTHRWRGLGRPLLGPLLPHLAGITQLIIAPEGIFHVLPLHALWIGTAGETLLDHCAVSYIPALGLLERLDHRPDRSAAAADLSGLSSVVMGYTNADPKTKEGTHERRIFLGEARTVAARLGVAPLLDGAATAAALEAATERPLRVLHLSCHGYFDVQDALASGVLLADGVYRARRFMDRRLAAELVTLSACQTGISGSLGGDEMAGLSMALLSAGAGALLLGLWSVSAVTTAFLMDRFYALLDAAEGKGATTAETLRRTMLAFRDGNVIPPQGDFDPADPYYWAPFVLVGNWR